MGSLPVPWHPQPVPRIPCQPLAPYLSLGIPCVSSGSPACPQGPCLSLGSLPVPGILCLCPSSLPVPGSPACLPAGHGPCRAPCWLPELPLWVPTPAVPSLSPGPRGGSPAQPLPAEPLSSVSSLEVHFDLLDLTELTDMSDQELAEVFADSDEENVAGESPSGERAGPSSACPSVHPCLSCVSPQGCSRRRCHGPGTCARPPGPEHGSRDGTRSTSATRSCRRDPRTPSCPPSGPESPKGCPGPGRRRGHAGGHTDMVTRRCRPLPGSAGARTRHLAQGSRAQDRCGRTGVQRHQGPDPGPGGPQPRGGQHGASQSQWPGAGMAVAPGSGGPGLVERGRYRCPPRTHVAALSSGKTDRPTTATALPVSIAGGGKGGGGQRRGPPGGTWGSCRAQEAQQADTGNALDRTEGGRPVPGQH